MNGAAAAMGDVENAKRIRPGVGASARAATHGVERVANPSAVGEVMMSICAPSVYVKDIWIAFMHSMSYVNT